MRKKLWTLISILVFIVIFPRAGLPEGAVFKLGVMLCLNGECAEWGRNSLKGAELAAEQINAAGGMAGKRLELVVEDSQDAVPATTVNAFRKLTLDPGVRLIVGPTWTVGAMTVAPLIAARKDVTVISPSVGLRDFNESSENIFNVWPHDELATRKLARYAIEKNWRRAAVYSSEDPWVKSQSDIFEEEYKKLGGRLVIRVEPAPSIRDVRAEALKIKAATPEVVFMANYQMDSLARELRNLKFEVPKLAILMDKDRVIAAQGALEGTVFGLYESPAPDFTAAYRQKFGVDPGITSDTGYDAVMLCRDAVRRANSSDPAKIRDALFATKGYVGASGTFSIDAKGAVDKKPVLWRVRGTDYGLVE